VSGGAGFGAAAAAAAEMARFYDLPVLGSGLGADPWATGAQAGYEKAVSAVMGGLAWPDLFVGPGMLAGATVLSFEELLVDVEIWRLTRKAHQGIDTGDDKWLDDVIARVGPGGNFLGERSTRVNARSDEWFRPRLGWHDARDAWLAAGSPDMLDEASAKVDEILATHEPLPLGEDVEGALAQLRRRALEADA
jgi:trimethylamine--corrinoid protein Co-methyltransferase